MAITVLQTKTATGTIATTLTVTISATTAGSSLFVTTGEFKATGAQFVTGVTAGAATFTDGQFQQDGGGAVFSEVWWADNIPSGITSVVITFQGANTDTAAIVYEVSGLTSSSVDTSTGNGANSSSSPFSWSSGTSTTLAQSSEIAIGTTAQAIVTTITGPGAPWVNTALTSVSLKMMSGTKILSSTAGVAYAGSTTFTGTADFATCVMMFKGAAASTLSRLLLAVFP